MTTETQPQPQPPTIERTKPKRERVDGLTIDDIKTLDIDDAVWVHDGADGATVVTVSIADVAREVLSGSEHDVAARARVETRYFASGNSPMLPRVLADDKLSLRVYQERRTMSVEVTLRTDGTRGVRVFRSRMRSAARLSYDQIPILLARENGEDPERNRITTVVTRLSRIAASLLDARRKDGALTLYDLNNGWVTNEEGALTQLERRTDTIGYVLVQEMMILANSALAEFAIANDIPILFRNHTARASAPEGRELAEQIESAIHAPAAQLDALRKRVHMLLNRAEYSASVSGHYGLALPAYTHWTSPIRRYADLVSHRQVRAFLSGEPYPHSREEIQALATHVNAVIEAEREAVSQRHADKAEALAQARLDDERRIDSLDMKSFERVMKVAARSGLDAGEHFVRACERRIAEGRMSNCARCVALFEAPHLPHWFGLRAKIVTSLRKTTEDAVAILSMASQTLDVPMPVLEAEMTGAS
ncbi:MAG: ribonuclease catalytic domain-containing protein, partial [Polyangiales bacterium]